MEWLAQYFFCWSIPCYVITCFQPSTFWAISRALRSWYCPHSSKSIHKIKFCLHVCTHHLYLNLLFWQSLQSNMVLLLLMEKIQIWSFPPNSAPKSTVSNHLCSTKLGWVVERPDQLEKYHDPFSTWQCGENMALQWIPLPWCSVWPLRNR